MDTIFALASGPGKAGVAVLRLSGPGAHGALQALCGGCPPMRELRLASVRGQDGTLLDQALIVAFPEGASFTGEPVAELQLHGSPAVVAAVSAEITAQGLARMADPGEFTRRALLNGRLDLAEVEALGDLIDSETEAQRRQAMVALSGRLGDLVASWRADLVQGMALITASIDFADEDLPDDLLSGAQERFERVSAGLRAELRGFPAAERIRDGFTVAILGFPNVGKSTLLNRLAGREAALTSDQAGTTRDVIEVRMDIAGLPVTLLDTAGLRATEDAVEQLGISRARKRAEAADLRVLLQDSRGIPEGVALQAEDIILAAKADQESEDGVSGVSGAGIDRLLAQIAKVLGARAGQAGSASRPRHRAAMGRALEALDSALLELEQGGERAELTFEEGRRAVQALDELVGKVDVEDLLDDIFRNFCLGK